MNVKGNKMFCLYSSAVRVSGYLVKGLELNSLHCLVTFIDFHVHPTPNFLDWFRRSPLKQD